MAGLFQRHPRYAVLLAFLLVSTFYILSPYNTRPVGLGSLSINMNSTELQSRLIRAEHIYDRTKQQRNQLIKKFGPTPDKITNFPPDVEPWPPYTLWDYLPAAFNCPHEVERHGALGDGGKWICGLTRLREKKNCVIYSFGINYESSFEAAILANTKHCEIWGYDFSVKSFGPEIPWADQSRTHFFPYGLAGKDSHGPDDKNPMYTLESLMRMNGHTHIDLLKIDIESWEFDTLETFVKPYLEGGSKHAEGSAFPVGQLSIELHVWGRSFEYLLKWWENLEYVGLRPFWTEPNLVYQNYNRGGSADLAEYSFINIKGVNAYNRDL
ncbi:hypothetical protein BDN72DRAFT_965783 [Pluteus cervinus]|uniref:Uncharacterized protein n=1 Tax=Pluteus cervinus TaxID=181527 RepID=A0ACD3A4M3_9AGAR|nr:hypothetical protein BDN72DRAFT_965783 [Pluteus cervinus]